MIFIAGQMLWALAFGMGLMSAFVLKWTHRQSKAAKEDFWFDVFLLSVLTVAGVSSAVCLAWLGAIQ